MDRNAIARRLGKTTNNVGNPATSTWANPGFKAGQGMMAGLPGGSGGKAVSLPQLMGGNKNKNKNNGDLTGIQYAAKRRLEQGRQNGA